MKSLLHVAAFAVAVAIFSIAPMLAREAGPAQQVRPAEPAKAQPAKAELPKAELAKQEQKDPKWVETMQKLLKELTDDNVGLRAENEGLRADVEAMKRELAASNEKLRQLEANRGVLVVPPNAPQVPNGKQTSNANAVPKNWQPFEFNGVTYYKIPLADSKQESASGGQARPATGTDGTIIVPKAKE